jgi:hypothetical protein
MIDRYGYDSQGEYRNDEREFKDLYSQIEENDRRDSAMLRGNPISLPELNINKQVKTESIALQNQQDLKLINQLESSQLSGTRRQKQSVDSQYRL